MNRTTVLVDKNFAWQVETAVEVVGHWGEEPWMRGLLQTVKALKAAMDEGRDVVLTTDAAQMPGPVRELLAVAHVWDPKDLSKMPGCAAARRLGLVNKAGSLTPAGVLAAA